MKKIRFLFRGNFEVGRRDKFFEEGQIEEVDDLDAARLIEGLCAEDVEEERPKSKRASKEAAKWQPEEQ